MGSFPIAEGLRFVTDNQNRYLRSGLQVFLRVQNFPNSGDPVELGVPYVPTGAGLAQSGYTDILIDPPPSVKDISLHNIALLQMMPAGKFYFGDKVFTVSHTFVQNMMDQYPGIIDPYDVWRHWDDQTPVVGIVYNNRMHSIASITHREFGGETVSWTIIGQASERKLDVGAEEVTQP